MKQILVMENNKGRISTRMMTMVAMLSGIKLEVQVSVYLNTVKITVSI